MKISEIFARDEGVALLLLRASKEAAAVLNRAQAVKNDRRPDTVERGCRYIILWSTRRRGIRTECGCKRPDAP